MLIDLLVVSATDSTYDVVLQYRDMAVTGEMPPDPRSAEAVMKVMKSVDGLRVVARTTDTGSFLEVTNGDEISAHCEGIIKGIMDLASSDDERATMEAAFRKLITPETMAITASEDIGYLLFPFGVEYTLNERISGDTELPNPLGGAPIPAVIEVTMVTLDTVSEQAKFQGGQRADPSSMSKSVISLMESMGTEMSKKDKKEFEKVMREMDVSDTYEFEVDLKGAWVTRANCVRTVKAQDIVQTDARVYTLQ